jgi:thiamine-phosphate pyrophosphorylase
MLFNPQKPTIYLITSGETTVQTTPASNDFANVLRLVEAAVAARIDLVQIREKNLNAAVLYILCASAVKITSGSATRLLVNDRSDIAAAVGADGVHLTTHSLPTDVVRCTFGSDLLIGVSTHSLEEATLARRSGADFIVFGPVFATSTKQQYGPALGLEILRQVTCALAPFPVLALGGIDVQNMTDCIVAGADGIGAIRLLSNPLRVGEVADQLREKCTLEPD